MSTETKTGPSDEAMKAAHDIAVWGVGPTPSRITVQILSAIIDRHFAPLRAEVERLKARADLDQTTAAENTADYTLQLAALAQENAELKTERDRFKDGYDDRLSQVSGLLRDLAAAKRDSERLDAGQIILWDGMTKIHFSKQNLRAAIDDAMEGKE
jgi:uncharacterized small protein (DUF1192 family)